MTIDMHYLLSPRSTNQDEWCHYIKEQAKRIKRLIAADLDDPGIIDAYKDYLFKYIELGWATEEEND